MIFLHILHPGPPQQSRLRGGPGPADRLGWWWCGDGARRGVCGAAAGVGAGRCGGCAGWGGVGGYTHG